MMTTEPQRRSVILAGGGTGGHLFPGIAVADELVRRDTNTRIQFWGSVKLLEKQIVDAAGYEHVPLASVPPSLIPGRIWNSVVRNGQAYRIARTLLAAEQPDVVIGLGGFASVPPVLAARRSGVPVVLLEQNVIPGKATRWLSRFADVVCLPFDETWKHIPAGVKAVVTGNPIRRKIAELATCEATDLNSPPTLLILGGSQGAATLNAAVLDSLASLVSQLADWRIVHQTGAADCDSIRQRSAALPLQFETQPFLGDMATVYRSATCVISRAGATTLAELACAGIPAILLPLPKSAHDHQRLNARLFADRGAVMIVEEGVDAAETARGLAVSLAELISDASRRERMRQAMRKLARPNAAAAVTEQLNFRR